MPQDLIAEEICERGWTIPLNRTELQNLDMRGELNIHGNKIIVSKSELERDCRNGGERTITETVIV